mmetsp:Transcript_35182/g.113323  ORF Transcript_35182/g.113323 Transcript_35182/m.113323 type:complete len:248 (+) Transcript_35182:218-961(+)
MYASVGGWLAGYGGRSGRRAPTNRHRCCSLRPAPPSTTWCQGVTIDVQTEVGEHDVPQEGVGRVGVIVKPGVEGRKVGNNLCLMGGSLHEQHHVDGISQGDLRLVHEACVSLREPDRRLEQPDGCASFGIGVGLPLVRIICDQDRLCNRRHGRFQGALDVFEIGSQFLRRPALCLGGRGCISQSLSEDVVGDISISLGVLPVRSHGPIREEQDDVKAREEGRRQACIDRHAMLAIVHRCLRIARRED